MSKFGFSDKAARWNSVKKDALQAIADNALTTFDESFRDEGLNGVKKWDEVQRRIPGTLAYRLANNNQKAKAILTGDTGKLRSSNKIQSVDSERAVLVNETAYAQVQNEGGMVGGGITGTPHSIPARPFMVHTPQLEKTQLRLLKVITGKIWTKK